jgi:hypothetical protein
MAAADKQLGKTLLTVRRGIQIENNQTLRMLCWEPPRHGLWCEAEDFRLLVGHRRLKSAEFPPRLRGV